MAFNKQALREIINDQKQLMIPDYSISREKQGLVERCFPNDLVVILSGLRRSGKSTLLQYVRKDQPYKDYYFNFDDERLATFELNDFQLLYELFIEMFGDQPYFYFDEIQNIPGWERFVRRLHDYNKKIIITGSNAKMLSQELGTHLTGRFRQVELFPFSFLEFCQFHNYSYTNLEGTVFKATMQRIFNEYLLEGGIPAYLRLKDTQYLSDLYESIIYRDIVSRYHITSVSELRALVYHVASNLAKPINYSKLRQMLTIKNSSTIRNYLHYLQQSYLLYLVPKFDYSTKRQELAPKKIYFVDTKLAQIVGFRHTPDSGRLLENIVFLQLRRNYREIFYFQGKKECDFILHKTNDQWLALQVTIDMQNKETETREQEGLFEAMEALNLSEGWIITLDQEEERQILYNQKKFSIHIIPAWKWLLVESYQL
jgi:predicted AAA+ superfamily ATPase